MSGAKEVLQFHEMELDDKILKAIHEIGWSQPTLIQEAAIPLVMEGKDVVMRARTGSGKTAAFAIPIIQKILHSKMNASEQCVSALIIVPSLELCQQIRKVMQLLSDKCSKIVRIVDITSKDISAQRHMLSERPDVVVTTPAKLLPHLESGDVNLQRLETLVVDEADLIFSYGYANDLNTLQKFLPPIYQTLLVSATITEDVLSMKKLCLNNPVVIKLEEPYLVPEAQLTHQRIIAEENDKPAILYALIKLCLLRGKNVIFVNSIDRCYKLKLFLEQFNIKSCVYNSELPTKIRIHTINQFNQGLYDFIIASDENSLEDPVGLSNNSKKRVNRESGASRGIDFHCVTNVINFDFPRDADSYIHRAGRTARGNQKGCVLSFVSMKDQEINNDVENQLRSGFASDEQIIKNYQFKMDEVESFRYRAKDAWRAITRIAVHEARMREIKLEILNNEKLKSYFDENSHDKQVLRHDKPLKTIKVQPHLAHVPEYIVPKALKRFATTNRTSTDKKSKTKFTRPNTAKAIYEKNLTDPLLVNEVDYAKKRKSMTRKRK